tara:strand:+ start:1155 stop:1373 length:219 start_codon:yes stop_codon:yes gene_type:complete
MTPYDEGKAAWEQHGDAGEDRCPYPIATLRKHQNAQTADPSPARINFFRGYFSARTEFRHGETFRKYGVYDE